MTHLGRFGRLAAVGAVVATLALGAPPARGAAAAGRQCFPQTGFCAQNAFLAFWTTHGALEILGYPIDQPRRWDDGLVRQFYERAILEYHPENADPTYQVLLTRLGAALISGSPRVNQAPISCNAECHFFPETNHTLRGTFLAYWTAFGGLPVFGFPLTEPFEEVNQANGRTYLVQYFERNRFEYHPENAPRYQVLLGRLGAEALAVLGEGVAALPPADVPDSTSASAASVSPARGEVGTVFTVTFRLLHPNESYTVVIEDETYLRGVVRTQQFAAGSDGTLALDIDSSTIGFGDFRVALLDSQGNEIAAVHLDVTMKSGR